MKNLKNITHNFCNNDKKAASMFKFTHDFSQSMDLFYTFKPFCKHNKTKKSVIWFWFRNLHFSAIVFCIFNEKNGKITYESVPLCTLPIPNVTTHQLPICQTLTFPKQFSSTGFWTRASSLRSSLHYPLDRWYLAFRRMKKSIDKPKNIILLPVSKNRSFRVMCTKTSMLLYIMINHNMGINCLVSENHSLQEVGFYASHQQIKIPLNFLLKFSLPKAKLCFSMV